MRTTPPSWWPTLAGWLHLAPEDSLALWRLVRASDHPQVVRWRRRVQAAAVRAERLQAVRARRRQVVRDLLSGALHPVEVVRVLEALVATGRLDRATATGIEETLFAQTTATGHWT